MLIASRESRVLQDEVFSNFPKFLKKGDVLVLNNTKVFPARLFGQSETGAKLEILLIREIKSRIWETLARPGRSLKLGKKIIFSPSLSAKIKEKTLEGRFLLKFDFKKNFYEILDEIGQTPLPPYIKRKKGDLDNDRERYQTIYAKKSGAIAAPTAGLHFTPAILDEIKFLGVEITEITLHVGYGTFAPMRGDDVSNHKVLAEEFEISEKSSEILNKAEKEKRRIIAVGTTTTRALETSVSANGSFLSGKQVAGLTIKPGYKFKAISGLLTNFHLPRSSLLVLVSTFGEYDFIMKAYRYAVREKYRFYSYGDCMFIT
jgi:S-adenosylmethionine:tRNA ribosyltransferase-isomerase